MISIKSVSNLKEAELFWNRLTPRQTIFDEWSFRYAFYRYEPYPLNFLVAFEADEPVGLLPLQLHPKHGYEFFAEDPCEENRPFVKSGYEHIIPELYAAIPGPAKAYDISGDDEFTKKLPLEDYKYVLPLQGLNNFADFLNSRLASKRRRSLEKELSAAGQSALEVKVSREPLVGLEKLFALNVANFASESYLHNEPDKKAWLDVAGLPFAWRLVTLEKDGTVQAASFSVMYNDHWHYMLTGVNFKQFPGLGKLLTKICIEEAIKEEADFFDAGLGDCGWKNLWHFDKIPQYLFIKES